MKSIGIIICLLLFSLPSYGQEVVKWVFTDYPPANFQTAEGDFKGFLHDIVVELFDQELGIRVAIAVYPWKRCQAMVRTGSADIMVTIPTAERLKYAITHNRPIWTKRRILYTYSGHPRIDAIGQIDGLAAIRNGGYRVISYLGNGWIENQVKGSGIPVTFANSVNGMYRMLAAKRGDLIIEERSLAAPRIIDLGLIGKIIETSGVGSESGFHILISRKSTHAAHIDQLDRGVEAMRQSGRLSQIINSYGANSAE